MLGIKVDVSKPYLATHTKVEGRQTQSKDNKLIFYSQNGLY